jgi:hypothetical protein
MTTQYGILFILAIASHCTFAQEAPLTISCYGQTNDHGINKPRDSAYPDDVSESSGDSLTIASSKKWVTGLILNRIHLQLCKESATEYTFSTKCSMDFSRLSAEWTSLTATPPNAVAQLMEKYDLDGASQELLTVDRVNLRITDRYFELMSAVRYRHEVAGKLPKPDDAYMHHWVRLVDYRGTCKIVKTQL